MRARSLSLAILIAIASSCVAQAGDDGRVMDAIFAAQHVAESAAVVCRQARELPKQQRFEKLNDWIVPNDNHREFRIGLDFVANPLNHHGKLISPVLDWLQAADELGYLDQLASRIASIKPIDESMQTDKIAMELLLAMQREDTPQADPLAKELFERVFSRKGSLFLHRDALLLCIHHSRSSDELSKFVREPAQQWVKMMEAEEAVTAWHQHLKAATAAISGISSRTQSQWHAVSRSRAWEHGSGFPAAQWRVGKSRASNLSSHGEDFLFFAVPLQGDYEVESDVSSFHWKDTQVMTSGSWLELNSNMKQAALGNARGRQDFASINRSLTSVFSQVTFHCRAAVRQGKLTGYFNGARVHEQTLGRITNPWISVRSSPQHDGEVTDLRITGGTVPSTISLSDVPGLPGWFEHFQSTDQDELVDWRQQAVAGSTQRDASFEILGPRDARLPEGCNNERLLRYLRPMLEDGTIEYQFWYQSGKFMTHPALGRSCFLIEPNRVVVHSLTDGEFDRTPSRPDGGTVVEITPPLRPDAWNTVALQLVGDQLQLRLNGTLLHTHRVAPTANRQFGLFHYNDQTIARVRNAKWTGNWPDTLPSITDQSLAAMDPVFAASDLDNTGKRTTQKLNSESLAGTPFNVYGGLLNEHILGTDDAVTITRPSLGGASLEGASSGGYCDARLSPNMELTGDFDITVRFDSLKAESIDGLLACISLEVSVIDDFEYQSAIRVRFDPDGSQVVQCTSVKLIDGDRRGEYFGAQAFDATAGRLRLSRRENEILYRIAEHDSEQFRIIGRREFTTADIGNRGIRFGSQMIANAGVVKSRWTSFDVIAEGLKGPSFASDDGTLAELNAASAKYPEGSKVDLTKEPLMGSTFMRWGDMRPWNANDVGLNIQHVGTDNWDGSGMMCRYPLSEDFDITIEFDSIDLAVPKPGKHTRLFLQFETIVEQRNQLNVILARSGDGHLVLQTQTRLTDGQGNPVFTELTHGSGKDIRRMRLVRVGKTVYCLAGTDSPKSDTVLFHSDLGDTASNTAIVKAIVHTGGQGRTSQVRLKSWDIRCKTIPKLNQPPSAQPPKSILRSVFDLF